jgi:hypothetical protein
MHKASDPGRLRGASGAAFANQSFRRPQMLVGAVFVVLIGSDQALAQSLPDAPPPANVMTQPLNPALVAPLLPADTYKPASGTIANQDPQPPDRASADPVIQPASASDIAPLPTLSPAIDSPFSSAAGLFNTRVGQAVPRVTYSVLGIPSESVIGQPTHLAVVRQDLTLSAPIWQCATDEFTLHTHIHSELIDTGAVLPGTGQAFPSALWDVRMGLSYRHEFDNGWIAGTTVSVGSASDKPFHSINEMTEGISAFLRIPQGERNAWLLSLSYSPTAQLNFPIPMAAFIWWPSDYFRAQIGLPFQVMYRPTEDITLDMSYMLLTSVRGQVVYRIAPQVRLHAGYDFSNEGFFLADRVDEQARFFSYEQRVSTGVQYTFSRNASLDLTGGYVFGRYYFEGRRLADSSANRVDVGNGLFIALRFTGRW